MLVPRRVKFRKQFRGTRRGNATRGTEIDFGEFGLKATACGWISSRQIESARKTISHFTQRGGRMWIRIFPDKPITKKPPETRMGSGKGDIFEYVAVIKPGRILFEMGGIEKTIAAEALRLASHKIPVQTRFVAKDDV